MILPPHSSHTLQPLDVVLFKPLSQAYSNELTNHLHKAQGLILIKKEDFSRSSRAPRYLPSQRASY
jgi:hypothetical protein